MNPIEKIKYKDFKITIKYNKDKTNPRKNINNIFKLAFLNNTLKIGDQIISKIELESIINNKNTTFSYVYLKTINNNILLTTNNSDQYCQLIGVAYIYKHNNIENSILLKLLNYELFNYQQFLNNICYSLKITSKKYNVNHCITGINNLSELKEQAFIYIKDVLDYN